MALSVVYTPTPDTLESKLHYQFEVREVWHTLCCMNDVWRLRFGVNKKSCWFEQSESKGLSFCRYKLSQCDMDYHTDSHHREQSRFSDSSYVAAFVAGLGI